MFFVVVQNKVLLFHIFPAYFIPIVCASINVCECVSFLCNGIILDVFTNILRIETDTSSLVATVQSSLKPDSKMIFHTFLLVYHILQQESVNPSMYYQFIYTILTLLLKQIAVRCWVRLGALSSSLVSDSDFVWKTRFLIIFESVCKFGENSAHRSSYLLHLKFHFQIIFTKTNTYSSFATCAEYRKYLSHFANHFREMPLAHTNENGLKHTKL